jgi:hypothetical protein
MTTFAVFVAVDPRNAALVSDLMLVCLAGLVLYVVGRLLESFLAAPVRKRLAAALFVAVLLATIAARRIEAVYFPYPCDIYWYDPYCWRWIW